MILALSLSDRLRPMTPSIIRSLEKVKGTSGTDQVHGAKVQGYLPLPIPKAAPGHRALIPKSRISRAVLPLGPGSLRRYGCTHIGYYIDQHEADLWHGYVVNGVEELWSTVHCIAYMHSPLDRRAHVVATGVIAELDLYEWECPFSDEQEELDAHWTPILAPYMNPAQGVFPWASPIKKG